jgi:hypothetical protein
MQSDCGPVESHAPWILSVPWAERAAIFGLSLDAFTMLPAFTFEARPVVPVADAIRVELEAMAYRDGLKK